MSVQFDKATLSKLSVRDLKILIWRQKWILSRREKQIPPEEPWSEWGILSGRGWGKSLTGAQWLSGEAIVDKEALPSAVIAPTLNDVRYTCFEGVTGILNLIPPEIVKDYNKTNLIITLDNGALIRGFSAEEPERLRGPQFARIWCFPGETLVRMADGSERRIDGIETGEMVMTRVGSRRVLASRQTSPAAELWELRTSDGKALRGTANHPVWTAEHGFIPLSHIQHGDTLHAWDIATKSGGAASGGTSGATITETVRASFSIVRSTSRRMARSIRGLMSTTSTTIRRTTSYPIWRRCHEASIFGVMDRGDSYFGTPIGAELSHVSGGPGASLTWSSARVAETSIGRQVSVPPTARSSATERTCEARSLGRRKSTSSDRLASTLRKTRFLAQFAERFSKYPESKQFVAQGNADTCFAVSVRKLNYSSAVYDLKIEGAREFFANDLLVHNCDELAAWSDGQETWDMAMFGLRLGPHPKVVWTTTPKPKEFIRKLVEPKKGRHITVGTTYENRANLAESFFEQLQQYEGTQLGRQELEGELIDAEEGGIIQRKWLRLWPADRPLPKFEWIIMSLDTAFTTLSIDKKSHNPDPTACGVFGSFWWEDRQNFLLLDCWEDHLGMPDLIKRVKKEMEVHYGDDQDGPILKPLYGSARATQGLGAGRKPDIILIEDKGSGISLRQSLAQQGIDTYAYNPGRADKLTRLHMSSDVFARGQFWVPESDNPARKGKPRNWCDGLISQLCAYRGPGSLRHDDMVDVVTQAVILAKNRGLLTDIKKSKEERRRDDDPTPPRSRGNPYAQ